MTKTRAPIENTKLETKRRRLERGPQSRGEPSDGKGKRIEEKEEEEGRRVGNEGIFVIGSADEVRSSTDDVLLSEELQIQEVLFMTMQSEKKFGNYSLETRQDFDESTLDPTDKKGKRPIKTSYSKPKPGQSSRHSCAKICCKICMERAPTTETFTINPCNHLFCNSCIVHYITSKLEENIASIPCPDPGCKTGSLDPLTCQRILPVATFDKWGRILCESSLGLKKFYCPFKDCSALLIDGGEEVINCECPHCNRMFCARCKVPWHGEMSCEEFQRLGKDERGQEDLMLRKLAKNKRWQRCPQCRMYVEKVDGCMFMHCRCGYCFCYVCATPMSKQTHYCTKCQR